VKRKQMSSKQRRVAAAWAPHYRALMKQPVRGCITYGGGLNVLAWMSEAQAQGFHCTMTPAGVVLR
jgi:hypothetical protein